MTATVFFSWQADTPTGTGRNFIERALERAVAGIAADLEVDEPIRNEITVDRDTKGVPGSPPIVDTIFKKIDAAAVFVPDLTFCGTRKDDRPTPNPDVLIEYGWALKAKGHGAIVAVMNTAHGEPKPESMPFDLRHQRNPICYHLPEDADEDQRKAERKRLVGAFERALRDVFQSPQYKAALQPASAAEPFPEQPALDGAARFRKKGEPIGYADNGFYGTKSKAISLADGAALWLRVMPSSGPAHRLRVTDIETQMTGNNNFVFPFGGEDFSSFNRIRGSDGFGACAIERGREGITPCLAYTFTTSEIWKSTYTSMKR